MALLWNAYTARQYTSGVELNIDGMPIHSRQVKETAIPE